MSPASIGLLGVGAAVPARVRSAEDPIFNPLREQSRAQGGSEASLFYGNREHRVLAPDETLASLSVQAGRAALEDAGVRPEQVDRLYGYLSVAEHISPTELYAVHRDLKLGSHAMVVPVQAEFSNFTLGLLLAWEALRAGTSKLALVVAGTGWTRNVDYRHGHAFGIGDGAGAVVLGPSQRLVLVDYEMDTFSEHYGSMTMRHRPESGLDQPVYEIDPVRGMKAFQSLGMDGPARLVHRLLQKHGLTGDDITFIAHQATRKLIDRWNETIRPREYLHTFEEYGNMLFAAAPVTLARHHRQLRTPYLVLYSIGVGNVNQFALLLRV